MMKVYLFRLVGCGVALAFLWNAAIGQQTKHWYKGNLHTHTTMSDGDSTPDVVAKWYKDNGYQFLILSDHNVLTPVAELNSKLAEPEKYLLIPGEEVTTTINAKPIHINAYGLDSLVKPMQGDSMMRHIQGNVNLIKQAGAIPSLNHPNFGWAVQSKDLLAIQNLPMIEVYNGHPSVNNRGGGGAESLEQMWDALLTARKKVFGIAVDDAHHFKNFSKADSNPGRGWVVVRAGSLSRKNIMEALAAGDFYSSSGVELAELETSAQTILLSIKQVGTLKYTTDFLGAKGKLLGRIYGLNAAYKIKGNEPYVRAVVHCSNGDDAWVQAVVRP